MRGAQQRRIAGLTETLATIASVKKNGVEERVVADGEMEIVVAPYNLKVRRERNGNRTGVGGANRERQNAFPSVGVKETHFILLVRGREGVPMEEGHPLEIVGERTTAIQVEYTRQHESAHVKATSTPTRSGCKSTTRRCSSCSLQGSECSDYSAPSEQRRWCRTGPEALGSKIGPLQRTPASN